jgi:thiosulfate reductase cytochrome b subunit
MFRDDPARVGLCGLPTINDESAMTDGPATTLSDRVYRHPLSVRLWHWITAIAVAGLLFTGFNILNVHPRLYWGEVGNAHMTPIIALESTETGGPRPAKHPAPAALRVGSHRWDVTGHLGTVLDAGEDGLYFMMVATPESWQFGAMRAWHFVCAWILFLTWMCYSAYLLVGGRLRRTLLPSARQVTARAILQDLWDHLRLHRSRGEAARHYNLLQKVSYLIVLFVLIPLIVLSGLTMSNAVTARFPELYALFGGRQSARTVHAACALLVLLFAVVHIVQVFVAGFINELRSMITGYFEMPREAGK